MAPAPIILVATQYDLTLLRNNDYTIPFAINNGATPYNLTGLVLSFFLKASNTATDGSGFTNTPAVTAGVLGQFNVIVPKAQLTTAGTLFYHVDVVPFGSLNDTLVFGTVTVLAI